MEAWRQARVVQVRYQNPDDYAKGWENLEKEMAPIISQAIAESKQ